MNPDARELPRNQFKVLVVDDDDDIRALWSAYLENEGFEVHQAFNGLEGLKVMREQRPDVVLLDYMMPEMTGQQVCEIVRNDAELKDIAIMIVSARDEQQLKAACFQLGVLEYLVKPVELVVLAKRIRQCIHDRIRVKS